MVTEDEVLNHAIGLMLVGASLTHSKDAHIIKKHIDPSLFAGMTAHGMKAIQDGDRVKVERYLASLGVPLMEGQRAIDALLIAFMQDAKLRNEKVNKKLDEGIKVVANAEAEEKGKAKPQ